MPKTPSPKKNTKAEPYPTGSPMSSASSGSAPDDALITPKQLKLEAPIGVGVKREPGHGEQSMYEGETERSMDGGDSVNDRKPVVKGKGGSGGEPKGRKGAMGKSGARGGRGGGSGAKNGKAEYNKATLVTVVFAPLKPDWAAVGQATGLTRDQAYDLWRKSLLGNFIAGREWSDGTGSTSKETKIRVLLSVLDQVKLDWTAIAVYFPERNSAQVYDVWRKVILPRLKRGDTIE